MISYTRSQTRGRSRVLMSSDLGTAAPLQQPSLDLQAFIQTDAQLLKPLWTQWENDPSVVNGEIAAYRQLISHVTEQLKASGVEVDAKDATADDTDAAAELAELLNEIDPSEWQVPEQCIPIHANVITYDWSQLYQHTKFDVIMMDPPWQLATANPTRGVALGYCQLTDQHIQKLPIPQLQEKGLCFIWVINAKYKFALDLFKQWGYRLVDQIVWVKLTVNHRLAKSHGYYLQHAKEVCLVGQRGTGLQYNKDMGFRRDVILSERRGQSQKPEEIYEMIEHLVPNGKYLEIFARKNNLRNFWVSVGNEITGTGLPESDQAALNANQRPAGAVFGRAG